MSRPVSSPLSRFLRMGCAALALAASSPVVPALAQDGKVNITFFIWAGSNQGVIPTKVIEDYRAAHPNVTIDILESNNTITYPKMVAARRTTPDDPLVHCGFFNVDAITKGKVDDMWAPVSTADVPNMANVLERFVRPEGKGIGYQTSTIGIMYNTDKVKEPPKSWSVLWADGNDKQVTFFDYDTRMLAIAARLNGGDERNIDPGFEVWANHAGNIRALVDSNDAVKNLIVSGDAYYSPWFASLASVWMKEGAPLGFAAPEEGMIAFPVYLAIANGVTPEEKKVCGDLINTLLEPENAARYGELTYSVPVTTNAALSDEQKANPLLSLEAAEKAILLDYDYIAEMSSDWRERWDREVKFKMR